MSDIQGVPFKEALYYSKQIIRPKGVMIHANPSNKNFCDYITNPHKPPVSYHFTVDNGCLTQNVPMNMRAWHAGPDNGAWVSLCLHGPNNRLELLADTLLIMRVLDGFKSRFGKKPALTFHRWRKTVKTDPGMFKDIPRLMKSLGYKNMYYTKGGIHWR